MVVSVMTLDLTSRADFVEGEGGSKIDDKRLHSPGYVSEG